ncbi:hypothetical protein BDQ12DRAFT_566918, partial [Crucibulum laeve]
KNAGVDSPFKGRTYSVLVMRVPITFSPLDDSHVKEVLLANDIQKSQWVKAHWAKAPSCHSSTQSSTH